MNDPVLSLTVLLGGQGNFWENPETDPDWWGVYLWIKRN